MLCDGYRSEWVLAAASRSCSDGQPLTGRLDIRWEYFAFTASLSFLRLSTVQYEFIDSFQHSFVNRLHCRVWNQLFASALFSPDIFSHYTPCLFVVDGFPNKIAWNQSWNQPIAKLSFDRDFCIFSVQQYTFWILSAWPLHLQSIKWERNKWR